MIDIDQAERDIEQLVSLAIAAASTPEELVDAASAAAAVGTAPLLEAVAAKVAEQVTQALASSSAWEAELAYSKLDAWAQTGHRARMLAEAWGLVAPGLREAAVSGPRAKRAR